jgi:uncharacterized membrane protein YebE (DUF533 family)
MNKSLMFYASSSCLALILAGCVNDSTLDDPNAATRQGAVGGALVGLTLGALTGDAELAWKGAVAGGVMGGVEGAYEDLDNAREGQRAGNRDDAIASIGGVQAAPPPASEPTNWEDIDKFIGDWSVNISSQTGAESITATAEAQGSLSSTRRVEINVNDIEIDEYDQPLTMAAVFEFEPGEGYTLLVSNNISEHPASFVGEYQSERNRYVFYPIHTKSLLENIEPSTVRVELGFVGSSLWMVETYAAVNGADTKIQTYRFTKR